MSCVADEKAISHSTARLNWKNAGRCVVKATSASATPVAPCSATVHWRFVPNISTTGAHRGLITHGRYSHDV